MCSKQHHHDVAKASKYADIEHTDGMNQEH